MEEALVPAFRMIVNYVVNGLLGPRTAPWKTKHEARAREIAARGDAAALLIQAEAHAEALKSISSAYQDVAASSDFYVDAEHDLEGLGLQVMQHEQTRRQQNLVSVLAQAREYVGDAHVNDHEPDPDWTSRFFSDAQDVSSEGMQALWAKILAGEVERPGSTSIRTLGIMKDLDRSIAGDFRRLCTLSLTLALPDGPLIDCRTASLGGNAASNVLQDYGLAFNTLNVLNEYGLIISDYNSWQPYPYRLPLQYQGKPWGAPLLRRTRQDGYVQGIGSGSHQIGARAIASCRSRSRHSRGGCIQRCSGQLSHITRAGVSTSLAMT